MANKKKIIIIVLAIFGLLFLWDSFLESKKKTPQILIDLTLKKEKELKKNNSIGTVYSSAVEINTNQFKNDSMNFYIFIYGSIDTANYEGVVKRNIDNWTISRISRNKD